MAINGVDASKYSDVYYSGIYFSEKSFTNTLMVRGSEAIKNTIKMYLMSQKGDYRRNVTRGGPMIDIIGKPLTDEYKDKIESRITAALEQYSNIIITFINAEKDLENKRWVVHVSFTDTFNKSSDSMTLGITGA